MKKKLLIFSAALVFLAAAAFIWLGFFVRGDVFLVDYELSEDGETLILDVGIASSMGYTRGYKSRREGEAQYLSFYSTFGGFNSRVGAKSRFEVPADCSEIYFYKGDDFRLVLKKNESTGQWEKGNTR